MTNLSIEPTMNTNENIVIKNKNKCNVCRKKLGILPIECKCGHIFCGEHRYADAHKCTYDWHKSNQSLLSDKLMSSKTTIRQIEKI